MPVSPALVYLLCLLTSATCAFLLVRSYRQNRTKLILFSALCFVLLTINNLLVVLDILVLPDMNLLIFRHVAALSAVVVLLIGFIWDTD